MVWDAYRRVKANGGAAGVDAQSIEEFEKHLGDNLYKLWNRMSSGSYIPPPVRLCDIPKDDGRKRTLGIPTVTDRIAQAVGKLNLEPKVEPLFHPDSYGYRPGKSAKEAVGVARQRCWKYNWVIDVDIKGFFDNIDHQMMMDIVRKHTAEKWVLLYIERWLKAPAEDGEGRRVERTKGTPQGGVISPLLANLFLHEAFDQWMVEQFPSLSFERYADDFVVHCYTEKQAMYVLTCIRSRLAQYRLELHPEKTKIVYCKDVNRTKDHDNTSFVFLGFEFRPRQCRNGKGQFFVGFTPAVSPKSRKRMSRAIRAWNLTRLTTGTLAELAGEINPVVRGWMNYYGVYCRSDLSPTLRQIELVVAKWATRKYKKLHRRIVASTRMLAAIRQREPDLFAHWARSLAMAKQ
jgi:RNA-directed DNA polymerase